MNKTFVASLENHDVYLINYDYVSFYVNVLKKKEITSITLDIDYRKKNSVNDIVSYYEKIDNFNISLVIPVINFKEAPELYKSQSNLLSKCINYAYKLLTRNDIVVKDNINVIRHESSKSEFVHYFLGKFSNRLRYISLDDLVAEEVPYNKVNAANISFVIGKPELGLTIKDDEMNEIINEIKEVPQSTSVSNQVSKTKLSFATSGYVSYYLLGFLTAIVTLLLLTFLINYK